MGATRATAHHAPPDTRWFPTPGGNTVRRDEDGGQPCWYLQRFYLTTCSVSQPWEPAWQTTCAALADRQTDRQPGHGNPAARATRGRKQRARGGAGGVGHELETRGKAHMGKSQEPSPHGDQRPPRQHVHGFLVEFWDNLGGTGSPKPRPSPQPQQDQQVTKVHDGDAGPPGQVGNQADVHGAGTRAAARPAPGGLHRAQRASKATLNSCHYWFCSLCGWVFFSSFLLNKKAARFRRLRPP